MSACYCFLQKNTPAVFFIVFRSAKTQIMATDAQNNCHNVSFSKKKIQLISTALQLNWLELISKFMFCAQIKIIDDMFT